MKSYVIVFALLFLCSLVSGQASVDFGQREAARFAANALRGSLLSIKSWRGIRWVNIVCRHF